MNPNQNIIIYGKKPEGIYLNFSTNEFINCNTSCIDLRNARDQPIQGDMHMRP